MSDTKQLGSTTSISGPSWTGHGFAEPDAERFWRELPDSFHALTIHEIAAGNHVREILRDHKRGIVVLVFALPPRSGSSPAGATVHTQNRYGNYCYDDTVCTYEDERSGNFVAFLNRKAGAVARIEGTEFSLLMGSDSARDGMFLELYAAPTPDGNPLAECFYSDRDGSFSLTQYEADVPGAALAWLQERACATLPPLTAPPNER